MSRPHIVLFAKGTPHWMGGREYTRNLVRALLMLPEHERAAFDLSLVAGSGEIQQYEAFRSQLKCLGDLDEMQSPYGLVNRVRWKVRRLVSPVFNPRLQELMCSLGTTFAYPLITADSAVQPFRSAEWIPDFQYKHHPEGCNSVTNAGHMALYKHLTHHAGIVVLSSEQAEADCHELFPVSRDKTFVLHFRAFVEQGQWESKPGGVVAKYHLPEKFLLCSNLLAPTKNHSLVLDALSILRDKGNHCFVVFTGDINDVRNPGFYNNFLAGIHLRGIADCVRVLGLIPKMDQFQLLRASTALIQPSVFEGWHTGVEEAQLCGKKLIISDIPVHREQSPTMGLFFHPKSALELSEAMFVAWKTGNGHDSDAELTAQERYAVRQQQFARSIVNLAACSNYHRTGASLHPDDSAGPAHMPRLPLQTRG
jgi:glycosyltransferase involved in cell wall biosynthesis